MPEVLRAWVLILLAGAASVSMPQANAPISIRAAQVFDGRGRVQRNVVVTVRGSKIESVAPAAGAVTHDLGSMTLLPGFIDTHVHIGWHFPTLARGFFRPEQRSIASVEQWVPQAHCPARLPARAVARWVMEEVRFPDRRGTRRIVFHRACK